MENRDPYQHSQKYLNKEEDPLQILFIIFNVGIVDLFHVVSKGRIRMGSVLTMRILSYKVVSNTGPSLQGSPPRWLRESKAGSEEMQPFLPTRLSASGPSCRSRETQACVVQLT